MIQFDSYFSDGLKPPTRMIIVGLFAAAIRLLSHMMNTNGFHGNFSGGFDARSMQIAKVD